MDFFKPEGRKIHCVGIGGVGMTALAWFLSDLGWEVSGTDLHDFRMREKLKQKGVQVRIGHSAHWAEGASIVLHSSAIPSQHPELDYARQHQIPLFERMEAIQYLLYAYKLVGVTGSYGKSTTTTFVSSMMHQAGLNPGWLIGADLMAYPPAHFSDHECLVLECDESKPHFLSLNPHIALITNVGKDHLQEYGNSMENLVETFFQFAQRTSSNGSIILCGNDPYLLKLKQRLKHSTVITCGSGIDMDYSYSGHSTRWEGTHFSCSFDLFYQGRKLGRPSIPMPGQRNVLDAIMAFAATRYECSRKNHPADISFFDAVPVMDRRMEFKGRFGDCMLFDDEGDSPEVIFWGMQMLRNVFPEKRLLAVIQPHRFSRLKHLFHDYVRVIMQTVDDIVLLPVYSAGEPNIPGELNSEHLAQSICNAGFHGVLQLVSGFHEAKEAILPYLYQSTLVVTLGPGDVWRISDDLSKSLETI